MFEITRASAFNQDILYAAGMPEDAEAQEAFTRIYRYSGGLWDHVDVKISTQRIIAYRRPKGDRIAIYMSHDGILFSPEPSFERETIVEESRYPGRRLGRLSDLRQIGRTLATCGDGGQNYWRNNESIWTPIQLSFFDERIDSNWAFEIRPQGNTGKEEKAYWAAHPAEKAERERRINLYMNNTDLHSVNGSSLRDLYISCSSGRIFHWDGREMETISTPTSQETTCSRRSSSRS